MGTIARGTKTGGGTNFNTGQANSSAELNTDFNTIVTEINGALDDANVETATIPGAKSLRFTEVSAPANPSTNDVLLHARDNAGRTRLYAQDSGGLSTLLGAFTLEGINTTEVTTVSTTSVDLRTITLTNSCAVTDGLLIMWSWRKTSGAAAAVSAGLKINTTTSWSNRAGGSASNQAESGVFLAIIPPRTALHLGGGFLLNGSVLGAASIVAPMSNNLPNATITDITVTGQTDNAAVTLGVTDVAVYRMSRT